MAEHFMFFNSIAGDEREYDQEAFSIALKHSTGSNGVSVMDSVDSLLVARQPNGMILINPGVMMIEGFCYYLDDNKTFSAPTFLQGEPRTDRVIVRLDKSAEVRTITSLILFGSDGTSVPTELTRQGNIYEMCLAEIVFNGETITVRDTRDDISICGIIGGVIDCGYFPGDAGSVALHNMNAQAHLSLALDGNADGTHTSDDLASHEVDPLSHPNLIVDGNTQYGGGT